MKIGMFGRQRGERFGEVEHALVASQPSYEQNHDAGFRNAQLLADATAADWIGPESSDVDSTYRSVANHGDAIWRCDSLANQERPLRRTVGQREGGAPRDGSVGQLENRPGHGRASRP